MPAGWLKTLISVSFFNGTDFYNKALPFGCARFHRLQGLIPYKELFNYKPNQDWAEGYKALTDIIKKMDARAKRTILYLSAGGICTVALALMLGSTSVPPAHILRALFGDMGYETVIVRNLRLPRALATLLSGVALSTAGLLLQSVTGNELTSPNIIGVNSGAGFAVMVALCFSGYGAGILPVCAFLGAITATGLVMLISGTASVHREKQTIILAGVSVSALFNSGISFLSQKFPDAMASYVFFSTGNFNGVYFGDIAVPALVIVICAGLSFSLSKELNLLKLGDDMANSLGVNVKNVRLVSVILASATAGASVCYAGLISFVGLIVPHIARRLVGHDMRVLFPASWLCGIILVTLSDLAGRVLFAPREISAGVFLSCLGAPFFIYLLYTRRAK